jgi:hypothetical protein
MQTKEKPSETEEDKEYFIVSSDLINWMRGVAYTKLTLNDVEGMADELFHTPTLEQYLELQETQKPKIIT